MTLVVIVVGLAGLGVGLFLGLLYGLGMAVRILRSTRDSLPELKPTDGNVASHVLTEWLAVRRQVGFHTSDDVAAVRRVINAGVSARPALGEAITRLERGGRR